MTRPLTLEEIDLLYKEMRSAPNPVCYVTVGEIVHLIETARMLYAVKLHAQLMVNLVDSPPAPAIDLMAVSNLREALRPFQEEPK